MPIIDDINQAFRDFTAWNAQNPLPVGDPRSGIHNPSKADIRSILLAVLQATGNPEALNSLVSQLNGKADLLNSGKLFQSRVAAVTAGQANLPAALHRIITEEGNFLVLRGPFVEVTDPLFTTSPYWGEVTRFPNVALLNGKADLANSGKIFPDRISAVNAGQQNLPAALGRIFTVEGDYLVLRGQGIAGDDTLFETAPRWGVIMRVPNGSAIETLEEAIAETISDSSGSGDILAAIRDEDGNGTFMTARTSDGGPTVQAAELIGRSMREAGELPFNERTDSPSTDELLFFVEDADEKPAIDTMIRKSDGRFHDRVIASIAARLPIPRAAPDGSWPHPSGGRFARYDADLRQIVSWGSSSPEISTAAWAAMATELGATFIPKAKGGQTNEHVLIQLGVLKPLVTGGSLAAGAGSSAAVTVETMTAGRLTMLRSTNGLLVNGNQSIAGTLAYDGTSLRFTRAAAGAAVTLTTGWRFWSDDERLRNRMALIWSAKNDITEGQAAAGVAAEVRTITDYMSPASPRYLVIGLFPSSFYNAEQVARTAEADAIMAATYGDLFVPVMPSLLGSQIFTDLGLTATAEDIAARAAGYVPPSLMGDIYHLTLPAYGWITSNLIKPKLTADLGWYQEA